MVAFAASMKAPIDQFLDMCKIYVVVPVFNRKALIPRFLECMRNQTFRNFEVIVVGDGSTDGTAELVAEQVRGKNASRRSSMLL